MILIRPMNPIAEKSDRMTLGQLKSLLKKLPKLGEELDAFAADLEVGTKNQPPMPTGGHGCNSRYKLFD